MNNKTGIPVKNIVAGLFALVLFFGLRYKMSGTATPGGLTEMFDTSLIVVGTIGSIAALMWPRKR